VIIQMELRLTLLQVDAATDHAAVDRALAEGERRLRTMLSLRTDPPI